MFEQRNLFSSAAAEEDASEEVTESPAPERTPDPSRDFYTVSQLTRHLKKVLSRDPVLGGKLVVRGELSNVNRSSRGHMYFSLKDEGATLKGVMWASTVRNLSFEPEDGLEVFVTGSIDVYAPNGTYSLVARKIEPVGMGALQLAFLQIKEKLEKEGLFDAELKQPLPPFPRRIGIVTSGTGAVIHDMMRVIRSKNPVVDVLLAPVAVQGEGAAMEIAGAIEALNDPRHQLDLLIVGRGGGSLEDLFCFSEEPAVRAVAASRLPVVTGIGHEPDYSLCDAAADYSASTPTAAAEAAVPDVFAMLDGLNQRRDELFHHMGQILLYHEQRLDQDADRLTQFFNRTLEQMENQLTMRREQLGHAVFRKLDAYDRHLAERASALDAYNPLTTLARGYAVVEDADGHRVNSTGPIQKDDRLTLRLKDGSLGVAVTTIEHQEPKESS